MEEQLSLYAVLVPGFASGVILLAGWRPWQKKGAVSGAWAPGVAVGAGFLLARTGFADWSWPGFWPVGAEDRLAYLVLVASALSVVPGRLWLRLIFSVLTPQLLVVGKIGDSWSLAEKALVLGVLSATTFALWSAMERLAERRRGASVPVIWMVALAGAAIVFERANSISLAQQAGALAACFGAAWVLALWKSPKVSLSGAVPVAMVAWSGLLLGARYYAYPGLALLPTLLLAVAPAAAWAGELPWLRDRPAWIGMAVRLAAVALPVAIAVATAAAAPADPYGDYS
ncbi:MAG: hypothetical protein ACYSX0_14690 [Planctomycetota bacterium]